jgi:uncharacterized membrane protein YphA (DoxX/SURF4 family)
MKTQQTPSFAETTLPSWRWKGMALLRIVFGLVWAVDAWFKWQPDFLQKFSDYLTGALDGQPPAVAAWINFWINIVKVDPHVFAHVVAIGETAVALGLIFGIFSNLTNIGGFLLSTVIWTTAEGFGGPYVAGSADIGAPIIYALVFVGLFLANAGMYYGLDQWLTNKLGCFSFLASAQSKRHDDHTQSAMQPGHAS